MTVYLQKRAKQRAPSKTGALHFQRWLGECHARGFRVYLAYDESHAYAEPGQTRL